MKPRSLLASLLTVLALTACSTVDESHYSPPPPTPSPSASPSPSIYPVPSPRPPRSPRPPSAPISSPAGPLNPVPSLSLSPAPSAVPSPTTFTKTTSQEAGKGETVTLNVSLRGAASAGTFRAQWSSGSTTTTIKGPGGRVITEDSEDVVHQGSESTELFQIAAPEAGTWTMRTKVTSAPGGSATVTLTYTSIPSGNDLPVARFTVSRNKKTVTVNGAKSSDPDGSIVAWAWDWGDGTMGSGSTAKHPYDAGRYTITLWVTDAAGALGQTTQQVTVP